MATQDVRIEFMCDNDTLRFTHKVPTTLIGPEARLNPQYMNIFMSTIKPIISQHYSAAFSALQPACAICAAPKTQAIITPMSWLHRSSDPWINVLCMPACAKPGCDTQTRQGVQALMADMNGVPTTAAGSPQNSDEIMPCRVCKATERTFKCARCGIAFYCGKEHQKMDWPLHKPACKASART